MNYQNLISPALIYEYNSEDYILNLTIVIQYILYSKLKKKDYKKIDEIVGEILNVRNYVREDTAFYNDHIIMDETEIYKDIDNLEDDYNKLKINDNPKECIELLFKAYILITNHIIKEEIEYEITDLTENSEEIKTFFKIRNKVFDKVLSFF